MAHAKDHPDDLLECLVVHGIRNWDMQWVAPKCVQSRMSRVMNEYVTRGLRKDTVRVPFAGSIPEDACVYEVVDYAMQHYAPVSFDKDVILAFMSCVVCAFE
jgi:hypothetical protein